LADTRFKDVEEFTTKMNAEQRALGEWSIGTDAIKSFKYNRTKVKNQLVNATQTEVGHKQLEAERMRLKWAFAPPGKRAE